MWHLINHQTIILLEDNVCCFVESQPSFSYSICMLCTAQLKACDVGASKDAEAREEFLRLALGPALLSDLGGITRSNKFT